VRIQFSKGTICGVSGKFVSGAADRPGTGPAFANRRLSWAGDEGNPQRPWGYPARMAVEDDVAYFEERADPDHPQHNAVYAAMIKRLDDSVGRIREALEDRGLAFRPDTAARLRARLQNYLAEVDAQFPRPNPNNQLQERVEVFPFFPYRD